MQPPSRPLSLSQCSSELGEVVGVVKRWLPLILTSCPMACAPLPPASHPMALLLTPYLTSSYPLWNLAVTISVLMVKVEKLSLVRQPVGLPLT